ncbi:Arc family DNA-binding protein [Variovorax sp. S2]|uniref:Arc family DNA-binding protein n=1 Tax=Variovorax sp. S12S4 TaxID=3029170 RepID=UPI00215BA553|nr:Arc family DNA-binding protein [Variovorax sp. S12S4]MCR8961181.1 Arc family DNA-binding protein [Variovorax sp. S12S4]
MATSIDQKNFVKTALRLPPEVHEAMHAAAQASGRSYNAEIVSRLEASLAQAAAPRETMDQYLEAQVQLVQSRVSMLDMRIELVKSRLDGLDVRARLIAQESERLTREAKTDEDFARAEESIRQFKAVQRDAEMQVQELNVIVRERQAVLEHLDGMRRHITEAREVVERRIREGVTAREASSKGSINKVLLVGNIGRMSPENREFPLAGTILDKVIVPRSPPPPPANRGPKRSPNARKPKP